MNKLAQLRDELLQYGGLVVAFSGGMDSTFLTKVAHDVIGDNVIAVTAASPTYPKRELNDAKKLARKIKVKHIIIHSNEFELDNFRKNPADRCYHCKKELFSRIRQIANDHSIAHIADAANVDDLSDYRPGERASRELGAVHPLRDAGMTKADIRRYSRQLGLPTYSKPAFACLASRLPYGTEITHDKLRLIEAAEDVLIELGFKQVRVRFYDNKLARIELDKLELKKALALADEISKKLRKLGFSYVTLDLDGYRTGSMNAGLIR